MHEGDGVVHSQLHYPTKKWFLDRPKEGWAGSKPYSNFSFLCNSSTSTICAQPSRGTPTAYLCLRSFFDSGPPPASSCWLCHDSQLVYTLRWVSRSLMKKYSLKANQTVKANKTSSIFNVKILKMRWLASSNRTRHETFRSCFCLFLLQL